jgi:ABC-type iron transport system FetAB ATPase subunit
MVSVVATWAASQPATLHNVSLKIHDGDLVAVFGPTGCGKSVRGAVLWRVPS